MLAVALMGLLTVRLLTVTPAPRIAVVTPCCQFVFWPLMTTEERLWPCAALEGTTLRSVGPFCGSTRKPIESCSDPVLTYARRQPSGHVEAIVIGSVSDVGELTVTAPTDTSLEG